MPDSADAIRVRFVETNAIRATLAVSLEASGEGGGTYRGEVYGPVATGRTTLPASYAVPDFRRGEEALAVVLDPCYWSEASPLEYEIVLVPAGGGPTLRRTIRLKTLRDS